VGRGATLARARLTARSHPVYTMFGASSSPGDHHLVIVFTTAWTSTPLNPLLLNFYTVLLIENVSDSQLPLLRTDSQYLPFSRMARDIP